MDTLPFPKLAGQNDIEVLEEGAAILHGFALAEAPLLLAEIEKIAQQAPFRHMETPGGRRISVSMTNCGKMGWISDRTGYRYEALDPLSHRPWPPCPEIFLSLAARAAARLGFLSYQPDACLLNRYEPGVKLGLHQDRDEEDPWSPIVSVSLGLPAVFLWGGRRRSGPVRRIRLEHGDVVVWGGPARFVYHGVAPIAPGENSLTGAVRFNLTFRKVFLEKNTLPQPAPKD
ncbi:MAG: DNA oxidative demethylase AlkB [Bryobacteraceae bacterium]|nr:DNA oxidative demethylase AlkB [Bryobacteraceae bacterium]MDW8376933.1 DNA oxidative demethylase AlkB [Bryobacterales bacterium]